MRPKTSVNPLATRKYSAASVSPFIPVVRKSFGLSASPHTTNVAAGTPTTSPQNHRQNVDMLALVHPAHEAATVTGRVAPGPVRHTRGSFTRRTRYMRLE